MKRLAMYLTTAVGLMTVTGAPALFARGFDRSPVPVRANVQVEVRQVRDNHFDRDRDFRDRRDVPQIRERRDFRDRDFRRDYR